MDETISEKIWRIGRSVSVVMTIGAATVYVFYTFFTSPNEKKLRKELEALQEKYVQLNERLDQAIIFLSVLEQRDTAVYRAIFEAPAPHRPRILNFYDAVDTFHRYVGLDNAEILKNIEYKIRWMESRLKIQSRSMEELLTLVQQKEEFIQCIPAIMPVKITDLQTSIGGYGMRTDPVYRTPKFHTGLDFIAAYGKPIFATGNGKVEFAGSDASGYGLYVIINHDFGFKTLYGHMSKILVKVGEKVSRGQKIGLIGCTGKCVGPHCHYEVHRNGQPVNPINYFYGDLSPENYEILISNAENGGQAFD